MVKDKFIEAVKYAYGYSNIEARKFIKTVDSKLLNELENNYKEDCKKAFYHD